MPSPSAEKWPIGVFASLDAGLGVKLEVARDLGVPEVEVIRAFPDRRAVELDADRWEELLRDLETLGTVRVLVSNGATTIEVDGQFGGFSTAGEFFNVQTDTLDIHIRWQQLAAAFAARCGAEYERPVRLCRSSADGALVREGERF